MEQQRNEADLIIGSLLSARHPAREIDEINLQQVASRNNAGRWSTE